MKTPRSVSWFRTLKCAQGDVTSVEEGHDVERVTDDAGETTSAVVKLARDIDESASEAVLTCLQCAHDLRDISPFL